MKAAGLQVLAVLYHFWSVLPKESAFVSFPVHLSLYLLLQHVFLHSLLLHAQDSQLPWHTEKKQYPFALLLAVFWGIPLMDIPGVGNMRFKGIAKIGNYQKYLFFCKERRKSCVLPTVPVSQCSQRIHGPTKVTAHQADTVLLLMSCWDYLKRILNQEWFYLLQTSKNSTNLSCSWTSSWKHKHTAFDLKTHTPSLQWLWYKIIWEPKH